jgi:peptide/nickel transport system permease protein
MSAGLDEVSTDAAVPLSSRRSVIELIRAKPAGIIGFVLLFAFFFVALAAPILKPYSTTVRTCRVFEPPSAQHWLGCDDGGIDMLSELIEGGRVSLIVGFAAALVAVLIGGGIGLVSGYRGGWVDTVLMRITDGFLVIPDLVLMIIIADIWGPSLFHVIVVIGLLLWTSTARIIRAQVKSVREQEYIKRTETIGASDARIIFRHVLPQVGPLLTANTVLTVAVAILAETALAFIGLSDPTRISWGSIIEFAFLQDAATSGAWWVIVPAGVCIILVIMGCFLLGSAIEESLDPRLSVSHISVRTWRLNPFDVEK